MTRSQPELSPYDTGARCEPKLWQPYREAVAAAMRSGNADDIGNVDFTDDADRTVVTVHVSRSDDGMFTVHLMPACGDDRIRVELHAEKGRVTSEANTGRQA
ncbi:hypothetical protein ACOT81_38500 [Streptomyces sp. WI04-05B]|uniref:hypothetical protein n=1 Tax=Streptomyces TaxID=1883 RepID=UPI0029B608E6|nr:MULTISPECIES: hypothetical protein [Streptomyces]MDX2547490.1 hypothetical protein [Streptomyces sp. WI04-05B]MDX2589883.1 hypothetical protein [Streptomyces sp. WI04-05A]